MCEEIYEEDLWKEYPLKKYDFLLLKALIENGADTCAKAMTINQIMKFVSGSHKTIYNHLKRIYQHDYIANGFSDGNSYTFLITRTGKELYTDYCNQRY